MKINSLKSVRIYFREYCNCTSVHGFRYLGEKRTIFERIWWLITFAICLTACIFSIYEVYKKWAHNPIIVNLSNKLTSIREIPFPSVTVCPETKFSKDKFNYTGSLLEIIKSGNISYAENNYFDYMSLLCDDKSDMIDFLFKPNFPEEFYDIMDEFQANININNCFYKNDEFNCLKMFIPIITNEGICYTFNMLNRSEIFKENVKHFRDYHTQTNTQKEYPFRADAPGIIEGLTFKLLTRKNDTDVLCRKGVHGYKILIDSPFSLPYLRQKYLSLALDEHVIVSVNPTLITVSESVKSYSLQRRDCYLPSERQLKYFKTYTLENCKMECLTNFTLTNVNCSVFFMPRENGTKLCGSATKNLLDIAEYAMRNEQAMESDENYECHCKPSCESLSYSIESTPIESNRNEYLKIMSPDLSRILEEEYYEASLTIYYNSGHFISYEKNEFYGPVDFLANFGGLLGLFTGFSVISLMEIIYFLSIRIICNTMLYKNWAGLDQDTE